MKGQSPEGTRITDKTQHCESRPGAKEKIRNAKRAFKKRARQQLKREMLSENDKVSNRGSENE